MTCLATGSQRINCMQEAPCILEILSIKLIILKYIRSLVANSVTYTLLATYVQPVSYYSTFESVISRLHLYEQPLVTKAMGIHMYIAMYVRKSHRHKNSNPKQLTHHIITLLIPNRFFIILELSLFKIIAVCM